MSQAGTQGEQPASDAWTYAKLLNWTTEYLKKSGSESPQLDGQVLLAHAADCKRIELFTSYDKVASEGTRTTFRSLVKQRAEGVPVAYLVGSKEFYSLEFRVSPDVLVPRPETELLVVTLLDHIKELSRDDCVVADVGTGSGCIAITSAVHAKPAHFYAIDQSDAALAIAAENAEVHGVAERIEFLSGDLLGPVPSDVKLDFIVSNPPYVSEEEFAELATDVREHEPYAALVSGPTGTETIERLVTQAAECLKPGGWLMIEISPMIESRVRQFFANSEDFEKYSIVKDLAGHPRVVEARRV